MNCKSIYFQCLAFICVCVLIFGTLFRFRLQTSHVQSVPDSGISCVNEAKACTGCLEEVWSFLKLFASGLFILVMLCATIACQFGYEYCFSLLVHFLFFAFICFNFAGWEEKLVIWNPLIFKLNLKSAWVCIAYCATCGTLFLGVTTYLPFRWFSAESKAY